MALPVDVAAELLAIEAQAVAQCGAIRVSSWATRWPWESRSARGVGAPRRRLHRGTESPPLLAQHPERFLAFYGLAHLYVVGPDDAATRGGLSALLEHIGLTRRQREAFEMWEGFKVPQTEIAAALGVTQAAVSLRLSNAHARIARWLEPLPAVQPKPYRSATSVERVTDCAWKCRPTPCPKRLQFSRTCISCALSAKTNLWEAPIDNP